MHGYGPSEDDCWWAFQKAARMKRHGLLFASFSTNYVSWIVPMRFDADRTGYQGTNGAVSGH